MHAGYRCARCLERFRDIGAFPERCPVCGFEVARYQRQALEEQYQGVDTSIVSGIPMDREREFLEQAVRPDGQVTMSMPKSRKRRR